MNKQQNYVLSQTYDLKGKKENTVIQVIFIVIFAFMALIYLLLDKERSNIKGYLIAVLVIVALVTYMALHELTHGITIQLLSKTKSRYRISFPFLTTGSNARLNKRDFILVCLMPSLVFGVLLSGLLVWISNDYFIILYVVLSLNFAGSSGDYYQVYLALKTKGHALFKDNGEKTEIYVRG